MWKDYFTRQPKNIDCAMHYRREICTVLHVRTLCFRASGVKVSQKVVELRLCCSVERFWRNTGVRARGAASLGFGRVLRLRLRVPHGLLLCLLLAARRQQF